MNEAMAKIEEFAQESLQQQMTPCTPKSPVFDSTHDTSPKSKSIFRLGRRSPRSSDVEKAAFSDGIHSNKNDISETVSAEAQEAYNVLIASRSNEQAHTDSQSSVDRRASSTRMNGTSRIPLSSSANIPLSSSTTITSTANIRKPRGIPGRGPIAQTWKTDEDSGAGMNGVNPLRRLRESQSVIPRPATYKPTSNTTSGEYVYTYKYNVQMLQ